MKKIESIIVDGVVYDVKETAEGCDCAVCDLANDRICTLFADMNYCAIPYGRHFKRRETK